MLLFLPLDLRLLCAWRMWYAGANGQEEGGTSSGTECSRKEGSSRWRYGPVMLNAPGEARHAMKIYPNVSEPDPQKPLLLFTIVIHRKTDEGKTEAGPKKKKLKKAKAPVLSFNDDDEVDEETNK
eukprot:341690-Prorocentrum_minimum.AAC.4